MSVKELNTEEIKLDFPVYKTDSGILVNGDNLEVMSKYPKDYFDSCISDFPYDISFMGRGWDSYKSFYDWCRLRAVELLRIMKPGGYILIFGHPKTNHRMKSAFEDVGLRIIDEIDWVYASGFPKNRDISRQVKEKGLVGDSWEGWKTGGLKPAKEIVTVFQKPLDGTYVDNIIRYGCGGMNIDRCRVEYSEVENTSEGRFPSNVIFDEVMGELLDIQSGERASGKSNNNAKIGESGTSIPLRRGVLISRRDTGGASRFFLCMNPEEQLPFMYSAKPSKKEKGMYCTHVTVKPKKIITWLIKLTTPLKGRSLDITAGSGTHGVCCEELNQIGYQIEWLNIEMTNTEEEPYFDIAKQRLEDVIREKGERNGNSKSKE